MKKTPTNKGIAIFIAVIAVSAILLIVLSIANISFKEQILTYSGKDSKVAFYAADSGLECALYHDIKKPNFYFATNSPPRLHVGDLVCDNTGPMSPSITTTNETITDYARDPPVTYVNIPTVSSRFSYNPASPSPSCVVVVTKKYGPGGGTSRILTKIQAYGYNNTCNTGTHTVNIGARNIERALEITY